MGKRIVIALGGNALGKTISEQAEVVKGTAKAVAGLVRAGHQVVISHGNGPQVGMIQNAMDNLVVMHENYKQVPLPTSVAMSQGYIGYHLQKGIQKELTREGMPWHVATMVTQVEVDENDEAFKNPTKPIGIYYTEDEAKKLMAENPEKVYIEDAGRGYRRVVASPLPKNIVEKDSILNLLDNEFVVIACGGGGIPVIKTQDGYKGVDAVIDKDFASALLAESVDAKYLFILTAVDRVSLNYGKPDEKVLEKMSVKEAEQYCNEGHFAPGSMLPKVKAGIKFAKSKKGRRAVIASLEKAPLAIRGLSGTIIEDAD